MAILDFLAEAIQEPRPEVMMFLKRLKKKHIQRTILIITNRQQN